MSNFPQRVKTDLSRDLEMIVYKMFIDYPDYRCVLMISDQQLAPFFSELLNMNIDCQVSEKMYFHDIRFMVVKTIEEMSMITLCLSGSKYYAPYLTWDSMYDY